MSEEETVTLSKKDLLSLIDEIKALRVKVDKLEVEKEQELLTAVPIQPKPTFYSLSAIRESQMRKDLEREQDIRDSPEMEYAVEAILQDVKQNPIKKY